MSKELVLSTTYDRWVANKPELKKHVEPNRLRALHQGVLDKEFTVIRVNGELCRFLRVPTADVFVESDGKRYTLHETGYIIDSEMRDNPARIAKQVIDGDLHHVKKSRERFGLSERGKLNGESREKATLRMIREELFDTQLRQNPSEVYPDLDSIITKNVKYLHTEISRREKDHPENSFKGLPVVYFLQPASITFTPDMKVPITYIGGVPQPLFELEEGKYINIFSWHEVSQALKIK